MSPTPRTFSHIGLSVPDVDAAVDFYRDVLGFYTIMKPTDISEDDTDIGRMCSDVFGQGWRKIRIAHMATADRVGIEIFEFDGNRPPKDNLDFRTHGTFHFAIQDPDVEGLLARIVAAGGKQRMPIREYFPGEKPYRMVYVEDPFGVVFELYSHSYELTYSAGAYD
ncbi:lactoylglutathione lyase family protein [Shimia abyssi]|uniref:Lactoylglutathione lyase family protein n=1 Tax=Shimia abyssi TaxID=1662395 RepID=A0A2P8FHM5_9RHOB|nr:lactoylglutathione lyase family protein [Shimia abyssi]PSL21207.1 lactoylglutathione lyase family protein [Shimia abyssi]